MGVPSCCRGVVHRLRDGSLSLGIQVQRGDADAADAADSADWPGRIEPSSTGTRSSFLGIRTKGFPAPAAIRLIRCISRISVPPLNLDASNAVTAGVAQSATSRETVTATLPWRAWTPRFRALFKRPSVRLP